VFFDDWSFRRDADPEEERMADTKDLIPLVKGPILIALAVTALRVTVEAFGVPDALSMVFGVAWLHILVPIYLALKIQGRAFEKPFITLLKATVLWAVPVRAVVATTYVLGYVYQIDSLRFQTASAGPVGEGVTPLQGFLVLPLLNFVSWMVMGVIIAAITGGITLKLKPQATRTAS
jgi:hypothetical protein